MPYGLKFPESFFRLESVKSIAWLSWLLSILWIGYQSDQSGFYTFFPVFVISFFAYIFVIQSKSSDGVIVSFGILVRLALVFAFPTWSDDVYRFFWDGCLSKCGYSPYGILPTQALEYGITGIDATLFSKLNSQNYYTVYPPISQCYYMIAAFTGSVASATIVLKVLLVITEVIGFIYLKRLLKYLGRSNTWAAVYFLHPLVIIEGVGNLHFEVAMIAFLAISLYHIHQKHWVKAAFCMALSIGVKLLPLMILPYLMWQISPSQRKQFFGWLMAFLLIIFAPMATISHISTFLSSVDLYFQKFEFNASVYYICRYLGYVLFGYNLIFYIGPILGITTIVINIYLAIKKGSFDFLGFMRYSLIVWTVFLLLATTVHPWYTMPLVFFNVLTHHRYPMVWSFLVILSYSNYSKVDFVHHHWWIFIEYLVLFVWMIFEWYQAKIQKWKLGSFMGDN